MPHAGLPARVPMYTPPHPGRVVRQDCIEALGLTISAKPPMPHQAQARDQAA